LARWSHRCGLLRESLFRPRSLVSWFGLTWPTTTFCVHALFLLSLDGAACGAGHGRRGVALHSVRTIGQLQHWKLAGRVPAQAVAAGPDSNAVTQGASRFLHFPRSDAERRGPLHWNSVKRPSFVLPLRLWSCRKFFGQLVSGSVSTAGPAFCILLRLHPKKQFAAVLLQGPSP